MAALQDITTGHVRIRLRPSLQVIYRLISTTKACENLIKYNIILSSLENSNQGKYQPLTNTGMNGKFHHKGNRITQLHHTERIDQSTIPLYVERASDPTVGGDAARGRRWRFPRKQEIGP